MWRDKLGCRLAVCLALGLLLPRLPSFAGSAVTTDPEASNYLRVETVPADAGLWINGVFLDNTPAEVANLPPGEHLLTLRKAHYRELNHTLQLRRDDRRSLDLRLEPVTGLVLVRTEPPGVEVRLDGAFKGRTPLILDDVTVGEYRVGLSHEGYHDETIDLRIEDRVPLEIRADLTSDSAVVEVVTTPAGAELTINGISRGTTPQRVARIPAGEVRVEVTADGYLPVTQNMRLAAGEEQRLEIRLSPRPGRLRVESRPPGARVMLDRHYQGMTPLDLDELVPGTYDLRVELEGYDTERRLVNLSHGDSLTENFRLTANTGGIELTTEPAGVSVFVDGQPRGVTDIAPEGADPISLPFLLESIPSGRRVLRFARRGYYEREIEVTVERGRTTTLHQALRRRFVPDYEVVTERRVYRGVLDSITREFIRLETAPGVTTPIPTRDVVNHRPLREEERMRGVPDDRQ